MALDNLISFEFTEGEKQKNQEALTNLKSTTDGKVINLTPQERMFYARVSYEMIPWVQKCHGYMKSKPELVPGYIDMTEFDKDMQARQDLYDLFTELKMIIEGIDDTMLLIGNDIYNNCIAFYKAVKGASVANAPGATSIFQDLKQQFPGGKPAATPETPPPVEA